MTIQSSDSADAPTNSSREPAPGPIGHWLRQAAHPATVRRARLTAMIVGTLLIAINHGAAIFAGEINRARLFQMGLTVIVPYLVSTVSSVATRRELSRRAGSADR